MKREVVRMRASWLAFQWFAELSYDGPLPDWHQHIVREAVSIGGQCGKQSAAESYLDTVTWKTQFAELFDDTFHVADLVTRFGIKSRKPETVKEWAIGFIEGVQMFHRLYGESRVSEVA